MSFSPRVARSSLFGRFRRKKVLPEFAEVLIAHRVKSIKVHNRSTKHNPTDHSCLSLLLVLMMHV